MQIYRYRCGTISTEVGKIGTFLLKYPAGYENSLIGNNYMPSVQNRNSSDECHIV